MPEILCLCTFFALCAALIICVYLGRTAIYAYTVGCILVSNCVVLKQVDFFGLTTSLVVFIFSVTYLACDILTEYWGKKEGLKLVGANLSAQIAFMIYSMLAIATPSAATDDASAAIVKLFTVTPRVTIAAVVSAIGGLTCVLLFDFLKRRKRKGWKALLIRSSVSTVLGNWVNTVLFFTIALYGVVSDNILGQIVISAIFAKLTVGILDVPFMLLAKWAKDKNPANQTNVIDWST